MNEAEWFACADPRALAAFVHQKVNKTKFLDCAERLVEEVREIVTSYLWQELDWYKLWRAGVGRHPRKLATMKWCDSSRNTETAIPLASGMEAESAFDRMPILADALQDGGCEEQQALQHCRNGTIRVRGCWVIDSVLGREL